MIAPMRAVLARWINALPGRWDYVAVTNPNGDFYKGYVKAWGCRARGFFTNDQVPHLAHRSTYSVATMDGRFIHVAQGRIASWSRTPIHDTVADVYGRIGGARRGQ